MNTEVILVDVNDRELGVMEKMEAHRKGVLHRAFSVFVFNKEGELLIQQRAKEKYHSGGLWSNTCCSHPSPGEETVAAAARRLMEEMGVACDLQPAFHFIYRVKFENDLIEYEYDHVFFGYADAQPVINKEEVQDWKFINMEALSAAMNLNPDNYTIWLQQCFEKVYRHNKRL